MTTERRKDLIIDARSPEMIERIEREKPLLEKIVERIKQRAIELFDSTGDMRSAIEQATREELKQIEKSTAQNNKE